MRHDPIVVLPTASVEQVQHRFEAWRASPQRGRRIPEELWRAAAAAARRHGIHRTALALGLNAQALRQRVERSVASGPAASATRAAFVELTPAALAPRGGFVVELENPSGARMRIHLHAAAPPDLAALARAFLGGEP